MDIILEYDDFHPDSEVNCLQKVKDLVNEFPNILINLFTIPYYKNKSLFEDENWCKDVRGLIACNKIRLAIHGTHHTQEEYKYYDYKTAVEKLKLSESIMAAAKLDFVKVFRGPHWGLCIDSVDAICDMGYTHIYSHPSYETLNKHIELRANNVIYNWNLKDEYPILENTLKDNDKPIVTHGHTHNVCNNGIDESYDRLRRFIVGNDGLNFLGVDEYYG